MTVKIFSRHPSHNVFRRNPLLKTNKRVLLRLGSTTESTVKYDLELNSIESIKNSMNKRRMKTCFDNAGVATADWWTSTDGVKYIRKGEETAIDQLPFPIIVKNIFGSRGTGNTKVDSAEDLAKIIAGKNLNNYIFEKFYNFGKEYRVHVSTEGVFLMWRKVRRVDTPADRKWFFNNENCNWLSVDNPDFDTPKCMEAIKAEAVKALNAVGLTIGGCDIRVQTNDKREPKFTVIEINSACSQAATTADAYIKEIRKLIDKL